MDRVLVFGTRGWGFESLWAHKIWGILCEPDRDGGRRGRGNF